MSNQALIPNPAQQNTQLLSRLQSGQLLQVHAPRGGTVIICHKYYAQIVGHGAAIGGSLDVDCDRIIPIGNVSFSYPKSRAERQKAYQVRKRWIEATQKAVKHLVAANRARIILVMLKKRCGSQEVSRLPDEVLAKLIGVLPQTMAVIRQGINDSSFAA